MAVLNYDRLDGTTAAKFKLAAATGTGVVLKDNAGELDVRNSADSAFGNVAVAQVKLEGATYVTSLAPSGSQTASYTLTLPVGTGSAGQVLSTDGSGVTSWINTISGATDVTISTPLNFGDGATVSIGTLPAHAVILSLMMVVDTPFTGGTATASVGLTADNSKYMGTGDMNLGVGASWEVDPSLPPDTSSEALNIYYSAGGTTAGAARLLVNYCVPV